MNNNPILSICIPTYNRAEYLVQTIKSIVESDSFCDEVEIVISDNCSTDNTQQAVKPWTDKYKNIKYFRKQQTTDISDKNFIDVLSLAKGQYIKLNNDTVTFKKIALSCMLKTVKEHIQNKEMLFFHMTRFGKNKNNKKLAVIKNLDDFVNILSGDMTWISNFGCWKKDFEKLNDKEKYIHTQFMQVDWSLRLFMQDNFAYLCSGVFYELLPVRKKGIVDLFEIYGNKYMSVYEDYNLNGLIKKSTIQKERRNTFFKILVPISIYSAYQKDNFYKKDKLFDFLKHFKSDLIFYAELFTFLPLYLLFLTVRKIVRILNKNLNF